MLIAPALEVERISSSRRGIQSEAAASAMVAPGALQIDAGKERAAAGFFCFEFLYVRVDNSEFYASVQLDKRIGTGARSKDGG